MVLATIGRAWRRNEDAASSPRSGHQHTRYSTRSSGACVRLFLLNSRAYLSHSARRQGHTNAASSDTAAAVPETGLEAFKALIAEKRFTCTQCGKCCQGAGEVWVSDAEAANIARYLGLPLQRFLVLHCHTYSKVEGFRLLRSNMDSKSQDCTFLRPDNTCAIHPIRPLQCSTYPWWPDLMDGKEWQFEKETVCEGFDHPEAPPTDLDVAAKQLRLATIQEYQKRLAYKPSRKQSKKAAAAAKLQAGSSSGSGSGSSSDASSSSSMSDASACTGFAASSAGQAAVTAAAAGTTSNAASWQQRLQKLQGMLAVEDAGTED